MNAQELMDRVRRRRRAAGLNVNIIGGDGTRSEFSFGRASDRDEFIAAAVSKGKAWEIAREGEDGR